MQVSGHHPSEVKEHFSLLVADFVRTRVSKSRGPSDNVGFFLFLSRTAVTALCLCGPRLLSGHTLFTSSSERKRKRVREDKTKKKRRQDEKEEKTRRKRREGEREEEKKRR